MSVEPSQTVQPQEDSPELRLRRATDAILEAKLPPEEHLRFLRQLACGELTPEQTLEALPAYAEQSRRYQAARSSILASGMPSAAADGLIARMGRGELTPDQAVAAIPGAKPGPPPGSPEAVALEMSHRQTAGMEQLRRQGLEATAAATARNAQAEAYPQSGLHGFLETQAKQAQGSWRGSEGAADYSRGFGLGGPRILNQNPQRTNPPNIG